MKTSLAHWPPFPVQPAPARNPGTMTARAFRRLKVGDRVTLAVRRPDYSCGHPSPDGRAYIPAGTRGVVGAVNVPFVVGTDKVFACIDFAGPIQWEDHQGRPITHWASNPYGTFRCAAEAGDLTQD